MKLFLLAMLVAASGYSQENKVPIEYISKAYSYDTLVKVAKFGEKIYTDIPLYFLLNRAENYVKILYKDSIVEYRVKERTTTDMWYAGGSIVHWTCTRKGMIGDCVIHWMYYERAKGDYFYEFIVEEPKSIVKYGVKFTL